VSSSFVRVRQSVVRFCIGEAMYCKVLCGLSIVKLSFVTVK